MVIVSGGGKRGYVKYGCHCHKQSGLYPNGLTIRRERLEQQLLGEIGRRVFQPGVIDYAVKLCQEQLQQRVKDMERASASSNLDELRRQRDELCKQAARLTDAIAVGGEMTSLVERLRMVEAESSRLEHAMKAYRPINLKVTAEQIREHIETSLMELRRALNDSEVVVARNALRRHLGRLVLTPTLKDGRQLFTVRGNVSLLPVGKESGMLLVARDGIGTPTAVDYT